MFFSSPSVRSFGFYSIVIEFAEERLLSSFDDPAAKMRNCCPLKMPVQQRLGGALPSLCLG
jgi:hypothetical protein